MTIIIQRLPAVIKTCGLSRATIYLYINKGLFPSPIQLGERAVAWVVDEVQAVLKARIEGQTDEQIRQLVIELKAARNATRKTANK